MPCLATSAYTSGLLQPTRAPVRIVSTEWGRHDDNREVGSRRRYSIVTKADVVAACSESVAAVAKVLCADNRGGQHASAFRDLPSEHGWRGKKICAKRLLTQLASRMLGFIDR